MYSFDIDKLMPGDIILTRNSGSVSTRIRQSTKSSYSHAMLYAGDGSYLDSNLPGVHAHNILRKVNEREDDAVVLRPKLKILPSQVDAVISNARRRIGTEYSKTEAYLVTAPPGLQAKEDNRQFCTRFVALAYKDAGFNLVDNPEYCTPQHILDSDQLITVGDAICEASREQVELIDDPTNPLDMQMGIVNTILLQARQLTGADIQTWEQLSRHVLAHPEYDNLITQIIKDSGFLTMWQIDVDRYPWKYNYDVFRKQFKDINDAVIHLKVLLHSKDSRTRHLTNLDFVKSWYDHTRLQYFQIQIGLYENLVELTNKSNVVVALVMQDIGASFKGGPDKMLQALSFLGFLK